MAIKTADEAKELFEKAKALSDEDIKILKQLFDFRGLSAIRLAGRLLIRPQAAYDKLNQLQEKGLVTNVHLAEKEIFASEEEQHFALTEEGQDILTMVTILPPASE